MYYFLRWLDSSGNIQTPTLNDYNTWILPKSVEGYDAISIVSIMMTNSYSTTNPTMAYLGVSIDEISSLFRTMIDKNIRMGGLGIGAPYTVPIHIALMFMILNQTWQSGAFDASALWTFIDDGNETFKCSTGKPNLN